MTHLDHSKMTAQEVFDASVIHMLRQGKLSADLDRKGCLYRGADNCICAAGIFLDDETAIKADAESASGWVNLVESSSVSSKHFKIISKLQNLHDNSTIGDFKESIYDDSKDLAAEYNLSMENVSKVYQELDSVEAGK